MFLETLFLFCSVTAADAGASPEPRPLALITARFADDDDKGGKGRAAPKGGRKGGMTDGGGGERSRPDAGGEDGAEGGRGKGRGGRPQAAGGPISAGGPSGADGGGAMVPGGGGDREGGREGGREEGGKPEKSEGGGIKWLASLNDAKEEARKSGKAVLIDFYAEWCGPCKELDKTTFKDKEVISFVNANYAAVKIDVDANKSDSEKFKIKAMPTTLIIGADETEIHRFVGYRDGAGYLKEIKKHAEKGKELAERASSPKAAELLNKADAATADGRIKEALASLRTIIKSYGKSPEAIVAKDKISEIEKQAAEKLAEMKRSAENGRFNEVTRINGEIADQFADTPAARGAREFYASLLSRKEYKDLVRKAAGVNEVKKAIEDITAQRLASAYDRLKKIQRDYADLPPVASEAKWHLESLERNPLAMRQAKDELAKPQCRVWLGLAKTKGKNGNMDGAREVYQKIIDTFPGTTFAETAKSEMALLR